MSNIGPILILKDDIDDQETLEQVFEELNIGNPRKHLNTADSFLSFLLKSPEQPFLIISDMNLPKKTELILKCRSKLIQSFNQKRSRLCFFQHLHLKTLLEAPMKQLRKDISLKEIHSIRFAE